MTTVFQFLANFQILFIIRMAFNTANILPREIILDEKWGERFESKYI